MKNTYFEMPLCLMEGVLYKQVELNVYDGSKETLVKVDLRSKCIRSQIKAKMSPSKLNFIFGRSKESNINPNKNLSFKKSPNYNAFGILLHILGELTTLSGLANYPNFIATIYIFIISYTIAEVVLVATLTEFKE